MLLAREGYQKKAVGVNRRLDRSLRDAFEHEIFCTGKCLVRIIARSQ